MAVLMLFSERSSVEGRRWHKGNQYGRQFFAFVRHAWKLTDSGLPQEAEGLYID